ncbi:hypothetical protein [Sinorhizobium fredii]|uniref:hypothetical protein n=1 Tax=Rhizobium fredii TaxID=380 RepID=UPI0012960C02|nr:hypothetical protein [Sinorhizobium fredii]MQW99366.1 hypothetical protein [Sinorhizobium fredii]UTY46312.1 hypothetical protein EPK84_05225 [Sinorhizobium fredii]
MNAEKMRKLIEDCQRDLWEYLSSDSGISDREMIIALLFRLDGPQARDALSEESEWRPRPEDPRICERIGPARNEASLSLFLNRRAKRSARP